MSLLGLWKHHEHTAWLQHCNEEEFIDHRCIDLLGALGTLMNEHWLSATVYSICSGHRGDLDACRLACKNLIPI
jgi:UDP-3-O-acyl-N-acetylglucosamine deacetylase